MKKTYKIFIMCFILFGIGIGYAQETKLTKKEQQQKQHEWAKNMIASGQYAFKIQWVNSQSTLRKDIRDGRSFLNIIESQAKGYFPYFGTVRVAGAYNGGGIEFDNEIQKYQIRYDEEHMIIYVSFQVSSKSERYYVDITVRKGLASNVSFSSNRRDNISYDGYLIPLESKIEN